MPGIGFVMLEITYEKAKTIWYDKTNGRELSVKENGVKTTKNKYSSFQMTLQLTYKPHAIVYILKLNRGFKERSFQKLCAFVFWDNFEIGPF